MLYDYKKWQQLQLNNLSNTRFDTISVNVIYCEQILPYIHGYLRSSCDTVNQKILCADSVVLGSIEELESFLKSKSKSHKIYLHEIKTVPSGKVILKAKIIKKVVF